MLKARPLPLRGWLYEELKICVWVLLPIAGGALLGKFGVPKRAARGLFAFAFYGCQAGIDLLAVLFELDTDLTSSMFLVSTAFGLRAARIHAGRALGARYG